VDKLMRTLGLLRWFHREVSMVKTAFEIKLVNLATVTRVE
jgi:uncharacterized membrane protein YczE